MSRNFLGLCVAGVVCLIFATTGFAKDEMVANPFYAQWASFKPGSVAVHLERTKLTGEDSELVPDGVEEKRIAYKLVEVGTDRVVLEMIVTEKQMLGYVESAPTRHIFPANVKKAHLAQLIEETGAKTAEEVVKWDGKDIKVKTLTATLKRPDGEQIESKSWLSDTVPGGIVKKVRTTHNNGQLVAETTTTLESYEKAN